MSQSDQRREIDLPAGRVRYREAGGGKPVVFVHGFLVDGRSGTASSTASPTAVAASPPTGRWAPTKWR